jgi:probable rRNA maturation factor
LEEEDLMVTITIEPPEASFEQLTGLTEEQTLEVIAQSLAQVGVEEPVEVGVLISTDEQLRILNRDFREVDAATDVLSFPFQDEPMVQAPSEQLWQAEAEEAPGMNGATTDAALDFGAATDEAEDEDDIGDDLDVLEDEEGEDRFLYLGDIAISHETAARQATQAGHSLGWECAYLLAHGVLHLVGYDDKSDAGYQAMVAQQEKILAQVGIAK